jgi:hypothetical protein
MSIIFVLFPSIKISLPYEGMGSASAYILLFLKMSGPKLFLRVLFRIPVFEQIVLVFVTIMLLKT